MSDEKYESLKKTFAILSAVAAFTVTVLDAAVRLIEVKDTLKKLPEGNEKQPSDTTSFAVNGDDWE